MILKLSCYGIATISVAANTMSASAIANGGGVVVATFQSYGAAGLTAAATAAVRVTGAAVGPPLAIVIHETLHV